MVDAPVADPTNGAALGSRRSKAALSNTTYSKRPNEMKTESPLKRMVRLTFGFAMLTLLLMGAVSYRWMVLSDESDRWLRHTHEVMMDIQDQRLALQSIESSSLTFALTGRESDLELYRADVGRMKQDRYAFQSLTADNPVQQSRLPALASVAAENVQNAETIINLRRVQGQKAAIAAVGTIHSEQAMDEFQALSGKLDREEIRLRVLRLAATEQRLGQAKIILIVGTLLGMLIVGIAGWTALRDSGRRGRAEEALRDSEEKYRMLLDGVQDYAIFMLDPQGHVASWSASAERIKGYTAEQIIGHDFSCFFPPEDIKRGRPEEILRMAATTGRHEEFGMRVRKDGSEFPASVIFFPLREGDGNLLGFSEICRDLSEHKQSEARYRGLLEAAPDGMVVVNGDGEIVLLNAQAEKQFGYYRDELLGQKVKNIIPEGFAERLIADGTRTAAEALAQQIGMGIELYGRRRDGSNFPIEIMLSPLQSAEGVLVTAAIRDITTRKKAEALLVQKVEELNRSNRELVESADAARVMTQQMNHSAEHDALTGLPNRLLLNDRVGQAIAFAQRHEHQVAVLFLDLDGFKHINDSLGHPIGDKLLQSLAKRLVDCVRAADTVSRQGGDEFVVLLPEISQLEDAATISRKLLQAVAEAHSIERHDLHITASIGVSIYPDDGRDAETLIKNADTAMYQAKENGRQSYRFFRPSMTIRAVDRQLIEEHLRRALERQEFALHYQPIINLRTGAVAGAEALLRWTHPTRGLVLPGQFIPVAEDCGLILPIGAWVLREACAQAQAWADAGLPRMTIAVNVSAMQLMHESFVPGLFSILDDTGLDPEYLELELTESALMKRADLAASILSTVRKKGIRVAVDDFGTGYSSLSYLRRFPLDALKIDQSFVQQITTHPDETIIVRAIISMGRSLNLRVIAEGVETQAQLDFLKAHQCDEAQGHYFGWPVPPQELAKLLLEADPAQAATAGVV
jgi:diguanylate cyclase (GGDEF)-like protein/PAS domain S-box-containing protein